MPSESQQPTQTKKLYGETEHLHGCDVYIIFALSSKLTRILKNNWHTQIHGHSVNYMLLNLFIPTHPFQYHHRHSSGANISSASFYCVVLVHNMNSDAMSDWAMQAMQCQIVNARSNCELQGHTLNTWWDRECQICECKVSMRIARSDCAMQRQTVLDVRSYSECMMYARSDC